MRPCPGLWIVVVRLMLLAFRFFFVNIISSQWVFLPFLVNRAKNAHIINVWKLYAYTTMLMTMTMIATTRVLKVILAIKWCNENRLPSIGESILKNRYASSPLLRYICPMQFKVEIYRLCMHVYLTLLVYCSEDSTLNAVQIEEWGREDQVDVDDDRRRDFIAFHYSLDYIAYNEYRFKGMNIFHVS